MTYKFSIGKTQQKYKFISSKTATKIDIMICKELIVAF
jgi:hypothetical protein